MQVDGVPIPRQVAYWVRRYVRYWQTHLLNIRRRVRYYGTGSRHNIVRRRDDTRTLLGITMEYNNKNTKRRRRRIGQADSDTEDYA